MIQANPKARELVTQIDTIIFDMDGVLIDISGSFRTVNCLAVAYYLREVVGICAPDDLVTSADIERFKNAGGFNDDWELTFALVLFYLVKVHENPDTNGSTLNVTGMSLTRYATRIGERGGGLAIAEDLLLRGFLPRDKQTIERLYNKLLIKQVFQELYAGDRSAQLYGREASRYHGEGYLDRERVLIDLSLIPADMKLGIQTGRTYEEAQCGLGLCNLAERIPETACITKRDGFHKPEPGGLATLASRLGTATCGIYIGDTLDDWKTVKALNAAGSCPPFLGALVLTGPAGKANEAAFKRQGADVIAENVNEVLNWINEARR
jgi:HAD superfamily hydrolase (TIGR01548 family)